MKHMNGTIRFSDASARNSNARDAAHPPSTQYDDVDRVFDGFAALLDGLDPRDATVGRSSTIRPTDQADAGAANDRAAEASTEQAANVSNRVTMRAPPIVEEHVAAERARAGEQARTAAAAKPKATPERAIGAAAARLPSDGAAAVASAEKEPDVRDTILPAPPSAALSLYEGPTSDAPASRPSDPILVPEIERTPPNPGRFGARSVEPAVAREVVPWGRIALGVAVAAALGLFALQRSAASSGLAAAPQPPPQSVAVAAPPPAELPAPVATPARAAITQAPAQARDEAKPPAPAAVKATPGAAPAEPKPRQLAEPAQPAPPQAAPPPAKPALQPAPAKDALAGRLEGSEEEEK